MNLGLIDHPRAFGRTCWREPDEGQTRPDPLTDEHARGPIRQQTQRWLAAGCFEAMVHDLRALLRWTEGRAEPRPPTTAR